MHYFHNLSSASGGFAPIFPPMLYPWTTWGTFVPRPLICLPLEKNPTGAPWIWSNFQQLLNSYLLKRWDVLATYLSSVEWKRKCLAHAWRPRPPGECWSHWRHVTHAGCHLVCQWVSRTCLLRRRLVVPASFTHQVGLTVTVSNS